MINNQSLVSINLNLRKLGGVLSNIHISNLKSNFTTHKTRYLKFIFSPILFFTILNIKHNKIQISNYIKE